MTAYLLTFRQQHLKHNVIRKLPLYEGRIASEKRADTKRATVDDKPSHFRHRGQ